MSTKKLITVFGATGAQGHGLVEAILAYPESEFAVRAVTRNPNNEKARALAAKGAEVVQGDIDDVHSIEQALEGAYGAFFVTFFWEHFSPEKEMQQAQHMAEAAKKAGLQHAIWSTLEDTREYIPLEDDRMPTLMEKYKVPHLDSKGASNAFFTQAGVPVTFLYTSFYWDNFTNFGMGPKRGEDGALTLNLPLGEAKIASIAAEDIGRCAYGIFKGKAEYINTSVGISGGHLTGHEMAAGFSALLGEPVTYNHVPFDVFRSFGFPGADDLGNMFQFFHDFHDMFNGKRDIGFSRKLNPQLKSFDEWLQQSGKNVPIT